MYQETTPTLSLPAQTHTQHLRVVIPQRLRARMKVILLRAAHQVPVEVLPLHAAHHPVQAEATPHPEVPHPDPAEAHHPDQVEALHPDQAAVLPQGDADNLSLYY